MSKTRKVYNLIIYFLMVMTPLVILFPEQVYGHHDYICLESGKAKSKTTIMFFPWFSKEIETVISKSLAKNSDVNKRDWRTVNSFGIGDSHSPHYNFHSALHQVYQLKTSYEFAQFSDKAKTFIAIELIKGWKKENSYFGADKLVQVVSQLALDKNYRKVVIDVDEVKKAYLEMKD